MCICVCVRVCVSSAVWNEAGFWAAVEICDVSLAAQSNVIKRRATGWKIFLFFGSFRVVAPQSDPGSQH